MLYMSNKVVFFSFLAVVLVILCVVKPSKAFPSKAPITQPTKAAPTVKSRHSHGHSHGHGHVAPSKSGVIPPPQHICPSGYKLQDNNTCYRQIKSAPKEVCKQGTLVAPGKCVMAAPALYKCPSGYQNQGKGCSYTETEPYINECSSGSVNCQGGCCITETAPVDMVCPLPQTKGHKHKKGGNNGCVKFEEVQPVPYCQNNYQLNGNICSGTQMAPCPSKAVPQKGSPPRKLGKHHKHHMKQVQQMDLCPISVRVPVSYRCPPGSIENGEKKHHHNVGISCFLPKSIPLEPVCRLPGGTLSPDGLSCYITKSIPPAPKCPAGFSQCGKGKCCKTRTAAPIPYCNHGEFTDGKCKSYSSPELVCFGAGTLVGNVCVENDTRPSLTQTFHSHKTHKKSHK